MRHIVAISGGKDSTALALRLQEQMPTVEFEYLCTPTGNEPPAVIEHLKRLEGMLGRVIQRLAPRYSFESESGEPIQSPRVVGYQILNADDQRDRLRELCELQNALPNFRMRWCTRMLKIEPTIHFLKERVPCVQHVGLRADEEERAGIYGDIEGVEQSYPFREWGWGVDEVLSYLDVRGVSIPWRTDCELCYHQRLPDWWRRWREDGEGFQAGPEIEATIGNTFRSPGRDTWPVGLAELSAEFKKGRRPKGAMKILQQTLPNCDMDAMCRVCTL